MTPYDPTPEEKGLLEKLTKFRNAVAKLPTAPHSEEQQIRPLINQQLEEVREIVRLAGCHQNFVVSPPPIVGGSPAVIDPFDYVFVPVFRQTHGDKVCDQVDRAIGVIQSGKFEERRTRLSKAAGPLGPVSGKKVFLVHGHDLAAKEACARLLEKLHLEAIVLHEQASAGTTLIEKVERYSEVAFAVVLLTPDDRGAEGGKESALRPRARQNVILELGFFLGRLGRSRVLALVKGELESPSDYAGVVYIPMDDAGAWRVLVARELKAAGLNVDLNDVA